jgi:hemolysin III
MSEETWPIWGLRDPVSAATHFVAFLGAICAAVLLWRRCRPDRSRQLAMACFGVSMILLYAASATYHALRLPRPQLEFFQLLDQSAIYGLIAGTYTPALFVLIRAPGARVVLLAGIWGLALAGVVCKWLLPSPPFWLTVTLYISMGWLSLFTIVELARTVGVRGILWAFCGGVFYTLGGVADGVGWPVLAPGVFGSHELAHVLEMGGSSAHFLFMAWFVAPFPGHPL